MLWLLEARDAHHDANYLVVDCTHYHVWYATHSAQEAHAMRFDTQDAMRERGLNPKDYRVVNVEATYDRFISTTQRIPQLV
jgi:hypothetical protein